MVIKWGLGHKEMVTAKMLEQRGDKSPGWWLANVTWCSVISLGLLEFHLSRNGIISNRGSKLSLVVALKRVKWLENYLDKPGRVLHWMLYLWCLDSVTCGVDSSQLWVTSKSATWLSVISNQRPQGLLAPFHTGSETALWRKVVNHLGIYLGVQLQEHVSTPYLQKCHGNCKTTMETLSSALLKTRHASPNFFQILQSSELTQKKMGSAWHDLSYVNLSSLLRLLNTLMTVTHKDEVAKWQWLRVLRVTALVNGCSLAYVPGAISPS